MTDSTAINRIAWDERAPVHAASPDYAFDELIADPQRISDVVRFDLPRLGDISGLRGVHLQCHIGTDTISLARLGARMTGLDFSGPAILEARRLADATGSSVDFVESDVSHAVDALGSGEFDLVFTGIGALCWLPDVREWTSIVAELLRPGGRLFIREGHPMLWSLDYAKGDGALIVEYPYFQTAAPVVDDEPGTYVQTDAILQHTVSHTWNHGIAEIISAVIDSGMTLTQFVEHDSVPWNPFADGTMVLGEDGEWRLIDRPERLPLTYTLQATRN